MDKIAEETVKSTVIVKDLTSSLTNWQSEYTENKDMEDVNNNIN